jgi:proline dehydrogenase
LVTSNRLGWRAASRFIAGENLVDAVAVIKHLNQGGIRVTLDYLGEHTADEGKALKATENLVKIIGRIKSENLCSGISIKLTQIGLGLDEELCEQNLMQVVAAGSSNGIFVRIDMEDSPWIDHTLRLFRCVRDAYGVEAAGVVIQSYLYRSESDVRALTEESSRIRLCKGAYLEPPEVAYPEKADVDSNYDRLMRLMIDASLTGDPSTREGDGIIPPLAAFATHDPERIRIAREYVAMSGLPKEAVEFQMLYGIRKDLQLALVKEGYPVRVYVPFGEQWYPYFMRRLAERPANVWFFLRQLFN